MTTSRTHYQTLRVEPDADPRTIAHAYRIFAKRYHPDRDPGESAHRIIIAVNAAYEILKHPERRARYDAWLRGQAEHPGSVQHRPAADPIDGAVPERDAVDDRHLDPPSEHAEPSGAPEPAVPSSGPPRPPDGNRFWNRRAAGLPGDQAPGSDLTVDFGRYEGWTLAAIARSDPEYLDWLARSSGGRKYATGIAALRSSGGAPTAEAAPASGRRTEAPASSGHGPRWRRR